MSVLLRMAFRNLARARRRTALTGGTLALGTSALVLGSGISDGIARQLTASLVAVQTGHLQVVLRPVEFQPQNSPFDAYGQDLLPAGEELARRIEERGREAGVVRAVAFLYARGTALAGSRSSIASLTGVLPEREPELRAALAPESGSFLPGGDEAAAYVASPLARKLRLGVGDAVSFLVQTPEGAVNTLDAVVCGVFAKGAPWHDNALFVHLRAAQALFDAPAAATSVKILLRDGSPPGARGARGAVAAIAGTPTGLPEGTRVSVETFDEAGRFSFSVIQANESALAVLSSFLFAAAAVGVVNALLMSVHERTREIGTVRALGMRRSAVVRLFVLEGLALGLVAAAAGVALGGAVVLYFGARGIPMNTMTLAWIAGGDVLYPVLSGASALRAAAAIALLSMAASIYPALAASRLEPREALQHA